MSKVYRKVIPIAEVSIERGEDRQFYHVISGVLFQEKFKSMTVAPKDIWSSVSPHFRLILTDEPVCVEYIYNHPPVLVEWLGEFDCYPNLKEGEQLYDEKGVVINPCNVKEEENPNE